MMIEAYYGAYTFDQVRDDVADWFRSKIEETRTSVNDTMSAIKDYHEIRFGPPDLACVRRCVETFERENGRTLRRQNIRQYQPPEPPTDEEMQGMEQFKRAAREYGIDTTKEFWFTAYLTRKLAAEHPGKLVGAR